MSKQAMNFCSKSRKWVPYITVILSFAVMTTCNSNEDAATGNLEESGAADQMEVLMITGGGWHDYDAQQYILSDGITERVANVNMTIDFEAGTDDNEGFISRHEDTNWAQEFDLVIYNMCFADNRDVEWSQRIVQGHVDYGVPAMVLHCAMHSYNHHDDDDTWRRFIGMQTPNHQNHKPFTVEVLDSGHPVMSGFPEEWETPRGELYNVDRMFDTATVLANAYGEGTGEYQPNIWVNEYEGVRVFGTTIGHHNETMEHENYLNLMANGLKWATGQLD